MKKNRIIAAGHICIDIAPIFAEGKGNDITKILMPGKLVEVDAADIHTGGSVANTGLAMKMEDTFFTSSLFLLAGRVLKRPESFFAVSGLRELNNFSISVIKNILSHFF